jgi:Family of unknown function (DUF6011)
VTLSDRIRAVLPHMSAGDKEILRSMRDKSKAYGGTLTQGQLAFVDRIIARSVPRDAGFVVELSMITKMFDRAATKKKNPAVQFLCDAGEFTLSRAKDDSKNPGYLYIKQGATYLGKIAPNGDYAPSREAGPSVTAALANFAVDPVGAAVTFAKETKRCCFCNLKLTDDRSVSKGYGPICADNFGLPWGE